MSSGLPQHFVSLSLDQPIWDRFFTLSPLVLIGSKEENGEFDIAPKHMAMPLGWKNYFCFVCSPRHATYHNIKRNDQFTVSYPRPQQVVQSSLAAAPRMDDCSKPSLQALPVIPAAKVDGVLIRDCYLYLECQRHSIIDGFDENSLIIGTIVAAAIHEQAMRKDEFDDNELIYQFPVLAYLNPGRFAEIRQSVSFPFPVGFSR